MTRVLVPVLLAAVAWAACAATPSDRPRASGRASARCLPPSLSSGYVDRVTRALRVRRDLWGNALLATADGPTYAGAARYLEPLFFARAAGKTRLTASGAHYVAFSHPTGVQGAQTVALHVADGSQILSERADGDRLTVGVGRHGRERYGACLARLASPRLASGYLPVLQTRYGDSAGVTYRQESFTARIGQTRSPVSFLRLIVDARRSATRATIRLTPSQRGLRLEGKRLVRGDDSYLLLGSAGAFDGSSVTYRVAARSSRTLYAAWLVNPSPTRAFAVDRTTYRAARRSVSDYWKRRLAEGATIVVPEKRVQNAQRNLLIQNLGLTWRYSIGNAYEQFSFPEGVDVAQVMGAYGFADVERAILTTSFNRRPTPYPNWKIGQKLVGSALHYRLFADAAYIDRVTPTLREYLAALERQVAQSPRRLLHRERYSSDIPDSVYGLHSQAVAWQGVRAMGWVWERAGRRPLAARCQRLAAQLEAGLRRAVRESEVTLPDGSLFIPARLLDDVEPYDALTASRFGSYWNLVMPYALASGLFAPGSREARGVLEYMLRHGSRLLGLVRAGAYALYRDPVYPTSGSDQVYGVNVARFLADNDKADQLVLSLYGHLAAGMTPGTFVSGEAASIAPLSGVPLRSMYLPPNGASNAAFLETLRLTLVHETFDADGNPFGLELAQATPRAWLRPGRRIVVRRAPTSFGPISFSIRARHGSVRVSLDVPDRVRLRGLKLRLRLPGGNRIATVSLNGRPFRRFDAASERIDLPRRAGRLDLVVGIGKP